MIVRPSIIGPSYQEPFRGWADSVGGMNGAVIEISRGSLSSVLLNGSAIMDLVPLDIVCNHIIVAAWFDEQSP